jgi:hypothetical protein
LSRLELFLVLRPDFLAFSLISSACTAGNQFFYLDAAASVISGQKEADLTPLLSGAGRVGRTLGREVGRQDGGSGRAPGFQRGPPAVKKMLFSMIVGLASLGMGAAPSQAGTFGLFVCGGSCGGCGGCGGCGLFKHCCSKCCSTICVRDYNAFSPSFCGNMTFNGCNPLCGGSPGCGPSIQGCPSCGGCAAEPCGPAMNPGPEARSMPYGGPAQSAAMGMYPPSVMPMGAQPNYWTAGYGR